MKQEMMGWQWHQLDHMQIICTSLQTVNHAITSPIFTGWMLFLIPFIILIIIDHFCDPGRANCPVCYVIKQ